jgi:exopolysaccharide production protein ExoQ
VSLTSRPVFADHLDVREVYGRLRDRAEDALVIFTLMIQSTAMVTLPEKFHVPGLGAVWLTGAMLCLVFAAMNPMATLKGAIRGWPFILLSIWALFSVRWTVSPYETIRGVLLLTSAHLFAFALAGHYSWQRLILYIAITLCGLVAVSVVLAIGMPKIGQMQDFHQGAWSGVWAEKQAMGIYACLGLVTALTMAWRGVKYAPWWIGVGLCAIAVIGSTSKTAIVMVAVALVAGFWLRIFYRGVLGKVIGGWVIAFGAILAIPVATGKLDFLFKALGRTSDLTGRTDVWEAVEKVAKMRPDQGWGFQAIFRGKDVMTSPYQWILEWTDFLPANAHSSWYDIYIQLGHVGVALLVLAMVWAWAGLFFARKMDNYALAFAGATLAAISFISFTETNLVAPMELQWFLVVLLATKLFMQGDKPDNVGLASTDDEHGQLNGDTFTYDQQ